MENETIKQSYLSGMIGKYIWPVKIFGRHIIFGGGSNAGLCLKMESDSRGIRFDLNFPFTFLSGLFGWKFDLLFSQIEKVEVLKGLFGGTILSIRRVPPYEVKVFVFVRNAPLWLIHFEKAGVKLSYL